MFGSLLDRVHGTECTFAAFGVSLATFLGTKLQDDMIVAVGFGDSCFASIDHDV